MTFDGFPLIIGWELTLRCNLRCNHCGSSAGSPRSNELTVSESYGLCDQFQDLLVQEVDFTGGEPLLHENWAGIANKLIKNGIVVNLLSNGILLDRSMVLKLIDNGISGVGISLDGLEETHDAVRGLKGSFKTVVNAITEMQKAGLSFNVLTTVNAHNISELPSIYSFLKSLGVHFWRLQTIMPLGRVKDTAHLHLNRNHILELGKFIQTHYSTDPLNYPNILCSDGLAYITDEKKNDKPWRGCPAGIVSCGIMSDGRVKGCLSFPDELVIGTIRENDLWSIWFNPSSFCTTRNVSPEDIGPGCKLCDKVDECKGGCSVNSYSGTGIFHNDPFCYYREKLKDASALKTSDSVIG